MTGGISFDNLYGSDPADEPAAAGVLESSARFTITVPMGTTPPQPFVVPFVARTVLVDNPSGSWYRLNGRWVPPWTIGAVVQLDLPATDLEVTAVAPAGHYSVLAGEDLVLVALAVELPPNPGLATAPASALRVWKQQIMGWSTNALELVAPVSITDPTLRWMLLAITVAPSDVNVAGLQLGLELRDQLLLTVYESNNGLGNVAVLTQWGIGPSQPGGRIPFAPGALITSADASDRRGIAIAGASRPEVGKVLCDVTLEYQAVRVAS